MWNQTKRPQRGKRVWIHQGQKELLYFHQGGFGNGHFSLSVTNRWTVRGEVEGVLLCVAGQKDSFVQGKCVFLSVSLTFLFRALSFSTTPSSSDTTESTTGKLLSVFSSSATTIVTWLVSRSMFFWAALKRLFRVSYGTCEDEVTRY